MSEPRAARGPRPNSIAALTASLVLIVGVGLGAYFLEVRGTGLQVELQRGRAGEILILVGALLAVAGTAYVAVASAVRQSRTSFGYRRLAYRALEVDYTDPEALREFDAAPELRDLVGMLMAERAQGRQFSERLEALDNELAGLGEGMERSLEDLGQLRAERLSAAGLRVTECWNRAMERLRQVETAPDGGAMPAPAEVDRSGGVVRRLEFLEAELERLRATLNERQAAVPVVTTVAAEPALSSTGPQPPPQCSPRPAPLSARVAVPGPELPFAAPPARFEDIQFPHFVGRPVEPITDRLEVTFEAQDGGEPADLPDGALLFEAEDEEANEPIVDLRALGAVEIGE